MLTTANIIEPDHKFRLSPHAVELADAEEHAVLLRFFASSRRS